MDHLDFGHLFEDSLHLGDQGNDSDCHCLITESQLFEQYDSGTNRVNPHNLDINTFSDLGWNASDQLDFFRNELRPQTGANYPAVNVNNDSILVNRSAKAVSVKPTDLNSDPIQYGPSLIQERRLSSSATKPRMGDVLKEWVAENPQILYPDNPTKAFLSNLTSARVDQISTWFANYRQRHVKTARKTLMSDTDTQSQSSQRQNILRDSSYEMLQHSGGSYESSNRTSSYHVAPPSSPPRPLSAACTEYNISAYDPNLDTVKLASNLRAGFNLVEAWRSTLPGDSCFDEFENYQEDKPDWETSEDFRRRFFSFTRTWQRGQRREARRAEDTALVKLKRVRSEEDQHKTRSVHRKSSVDSANSLTRDSDNYDGGSAASGRTGSSVATNRSSVSRRGRRISQDRFASRKPHRCSKCFQGFSRRSDMKRHMESICRPSSVWTCRPLADFSPTDLSPAEKSMFSELLEKGRDRCFCGLKARWCDHEMDICWTRPEDQRTFYRIDHIKRHLQVTHRLELLALNIDFNRLKRSLREDS